MSNQCVLQQLGVSLGHVILFDEPAPAVSVPVPLAAMSRTLGKISCQPVNTSAYLKLTDVCLQRACMLEEKLKLFEFSIS